MRKISILAFHVVAGICLIVTSAFSENALSTLACSDSLVYTKNWTDSAMIYGFELLPNGKLIYKRGDAGWETLSVPGAMGQIKKIAADNNRLLVLTSNNDVWWYTMVDDVASWAEKVQLGTSVVDKKAAERALPWCQRLWRDFVGLFGVRPAPLPDDSTNSATAKKYVNILEAYALGITTDQYKEWTAESHRGGAWVNLFAWRDVKRTNIDRSKIRDVVMGHWPRTVATAYFILKDGSVWWLDEEPIMRTWKKIEKKTDGWPAPSKFYPLNNQPGTLLADSKIRASNSVVCVSKPTTVGTDFFWIRWDYHQKADFVYWPLDWDESGWHSISTPFANISEFRFDTHGEFDPRTEAGVWHVPNARWANDTEIPLVNGYYDGFLGNVNREDVSRYPVVITVKTADGKCVQFRSQDASGTDGIWDTVSVSTGF